MYIDVYISGIYFVQFLTARSTTPQETDPFVSYISQIWGKLIVWIKVSFKMKSGFVSGKVC
jgi:hypothetical protein